MRGFLPGRKRVVGFDDEAGQLPCQELEVAIGRAGRGEVRAKPVIQARAGRGIEQWRGFEFLTEHIEQSRLMVVEILAVERDHTPYSVEKDDPQPQVDLALGFLMVKPPPVTVSTKSTSAFFRYWMLIGSTNSFTPWDSKT